ncbi:hypothetical protein [Spirulina subsalsa]|uniref:hypothetical protein n=1 Tax=Spirulina subsalsa TaxID=54311 RepID=UPI0018733728|nr:hypothetical protein [Spirulina subsalsa]
MAAIIFVAANYRFDFLWSILQWLVNRDWILWLIAAELADVTSVPMCNWIWQKQQSQRSKNKRGGNISRFHCAVCEEPMQKVFEPQLMPLLTNIERATHGLNSVVYEGWWCPHCYPQRRRDSIHLRGYALKRPRNVEKCPNSYGGGAGVGGGSGSSGGGGAGAGFGGGGCSGGGCGGC